MLGTGVPNAPTAWDPWCDTRGRRLGREGSVSRAGRRFMGAKPITVVVPALNEAEAIRDAIRDLRQSCDDLIEEILVIDDGSIDATGDLAAEAGATVHRHARNRGYGASLRTGIRLAKTEY